MPSGVGPFPVKGAGTLCHQVIIEFALVETDDRHDLAHVAGGENLVRFAEIFDLERRFVNTYPPASRKSLITRWRVMPLRNVPFGTGVKTSPPRTMKTFDVAVSATLPRTSVTSAL